MQNCNIQRRAPPRAYRMNEQARRERVVKTQVQESQWLPLGAAACSCGRLSRPSMHRSAAASAQSRTGALRLRCAVVSTGLLWSRPRPLPATPTAARHRRHRCAPLCAAESDRGPGTPRLLKVCWMKPSHSISSSGRVRATSAACPAAAAWPCLCMPAGKRSKDGKHTRTPLAAQRKAQVALRASPHALRSPASASSSTASNE